MPGRFPCPASGPDAPRATDGPAGGPPQPVTKKKRINVAVSTEILNMIHEVAAHDEVMITEAVAKLISYGSVVHHAIKHDDRSVLFLNREDGTTQEMIIT